MVRFILLAYPRSGSNLLANGLFNHDHIHMFSEIFNDVEDDRRRFYTGSFENCPVAASPHPSVNIDRNDFFDGEEDGAEFLKRAVFYKHVVDPVAVGFKIFFHQARSNYNSRQLWNYLICNKDIRVVHLKRENLIESWLSLRMAFKTNEWVYDPANSTPRPPEPFHLRPHDCETYLRRALKGQRWARMQFRHHPVFEVEYEADLCKRFDDTMYRLQDFLEVPRRPAKKRLRKQAKRKPSEQISNYEELKTHFAPTRFARWFE